MDSIEQKRQKIIAKAQLVPEEDRYCSGCYLEAVRAGVEKERAKKIAEASHASLLKGDWLTWTCPCCETLALCTAGTIVHVDDIPLPTKEPTQ